MPSAVTLKFTITTILHAACVCIIWIDNTEASSGNKLLIKTVQTADGYRFHASWCPMDQFNHHQMNT